MSSVRCFWKLWTVLVILCFSLIALSVLWPSGLSSSDSEDELGSPSYASFLQYTDNKPFYSNVAKKQMVGMIDWSGSMVLNIERRNGGLFSVIILWRKWGYCISQWLLVWVSDTILDKRKSIILCCPLFVVFSGKNGLQGRGTSWKVRINIQ